MEKIIKLSIIFLVLGSILISGCIDSEKPSEIGGPTKPVLSDEPDVSTTAPSFNPKTNTNSIGMEFVLVPAGEFEMGSPSGEEDRDDSEGPVHNVRISDSFYMSKYEVTQKQWFEVMGDNPSDFKGDDLPVGRVSWYDAQEFIKMLNEKERTDKYRLPSEAEWEYAARAGTTTRYFFGDDESKLGDYAWYDGNSGSEVHPVGQKKPNPWGLHDMYGNADEWVQDYYNKDYKGAPTDGSVWEWDNEYAFERILRGGSWMFGARFCRSAYRGTFFPESHLGNVGFRPLMVM